MKTPVFLKIIVLVSIALTALFVSCDENAPSGKKFADENDFLFLGHDSFRVRGPIHHGAYTYRFIYRDKYLIDGHEFYLLNDSGNNLIGTIHRPNCKACEERRNLRDRLIVSEISWTSKEILDSLKARPENVTKSDLEQMFKRHERNIVRTFDEILDEWD